MCTLFGRRRRQEQPEESAAADAEATPLELDEADRHGPWDSGEKAPEIQRIDLGGVQVPVIDGAEFQMETGDDRMIGVTVVHENSALQVRAFAAPKSSGIWDDIRRDIDAELTKAGGKLEEVDGSFGTELAGEIPMEVPERGVIRQPIRFVGVDGPRWMLQGIFQGRAAAEDDAAAVMETVFAGIVVVRGDQPMAPKDVIELRLPPEAQDAMEQEEGDSDGVNIFDRGPEITETR